MGTLPLILFFEGILTFISPCILPLLPVYIAYFLGDHEGAAQSKKYDALFRVLSFILGFSLIFVAMGIFANFFAQNIIRHQKVIQVVTGLIVILAGCNILGLFDRMKAKIGFFNQFKPTMKISIHSNRLSLVFFGAVFALGWTPCMSAYLGTALAMAAQSSEPLKGGLLLFIYALGLGVPFILSTFLLQNFKQVFTWIKTHFDIINRVSGILMILVGIAMLFGWVAYLQLLVQR